MNCEMLCRVPTLNRVVHHLPSKPKGPFMPMRTGPGWAPWSLNSLNDVTGARRHAAPREVHERVQLYRSSSPHQHPGSA